MEARIYKDIIYHELAEVAKAASDPKRLEIIDLLCQSEKNVELLAGGLNMSVASTSHHLQILKRSKLVTDRKDSRFVFYKSSPMGMKFWKSLSEIGEQNISEIKLAISSFFHSEEYNTVGFRELRRKVKRGDILLLDVRPKEEYAAGHFPGAISIPIKELEEKMHSLPRNGDMDIVAYCRGPHCVLSQNAVDILQKNGITAYRLPRGIVEWKLDGYKLEYAHSENIA